MKKRLLMSILFIGVSLCSCEKKESLSNQSTMIDNGVTFEASSSSEKYSEITQPEETANFINGLLFSTEYDVVDYCQGCFIVSKNDGLLYGVLDMHGNELIPCDYDEIEFLNKDAVINGKEDELLIDLCYENLHTIIDNTGEIIIENRREYIRCIEYEIGNATDKGAYFLGTSSNALSLYTKAGDQLIHLNFPGASSITFGPMISENYFMVWIMEEVPNEKIATFIDTSFLDISGSLSSLSPLFSATYPHASV